MIDVRVAVIQHERASLIWRVKLVSWLSLAFMLVEAVVGLFAGLAADSIALIGWGIDSTIVAVASLVIIWRFTGDRIDSEEAETTARKVVAVSFFLLAPYIAIEATRRLVTGTEAKASWVGIGLVVSSVLLMPLFGYAKKRIGTKLGSGATTGEGTQNILCAYLSLAVLIGLGANALLGLWWADPLVAILVAVAAVQAGMSTWRGGGCADLC